MTIYCLAFISDTTGCIVPSYYLALALSCLNLAVFHLPRIVISSPASLNILAFFVSAFVTVPFIQRRARFVLKSSKYFPRAKRLILTVRPLLSDRIDKLCDDISLPF